MLKQKNATPADRFARDRRLAEHPVAVRAAEATGPLAQALMYLDTRIAKLERQIAQLGATPGLEGEE